MILGYSKQKWIIDISKEKVSSIGTYQERQDLCHQYEQSLISRLKNLTNVRLVIIYIRRKCGDITALQSGYARKRVADR
jgi:hypothetical protein